MIQKFLYEIESSSKKSEVNHLLEQEQKRRSNRFITEQE